MSVCCSLFFIAFLVSGCSEAVHGLKYIFDSVIEKNQRDYKKAIDMKPYTEQTCVACKLKLKKSEKVYRCFKIRGKRKYIKKLSRKELKEIIKKNILTN